MIPIEMRAQHAGKRSLVMGLVAAGFIIACATIAAAGTPTAATADSAAATLVGAMRTGPLRDLVNDVLAHNPDLAALEAAAAAAAERPAQASALPDPMLGVTVFPSSPQTRVGPQDLSLSLSQKVPWFGKQGLRGDAAAADARSAAARSGALRLRLITQTRRLSYELAYVDAARRVVAQDRATLVHYEEVARSRYAAGIGLQQGVIKIQAEISKNDARRLELETQGASLLAQLNALRDAPAGATVAVDSLPRLPQVTIDADALRAQALARRPEMADARAQIDRSEVLVDLAHKQYRPDLTLGLSYTFVGRRTDPAGLASPPPDDGSDIIGVSAGINLPLWRGSLSAGVDEATQGRLRAEAARRSAAAGIDRTLDDLARRVPLAWDRLRLYEDVLGIQAAQALNSAEAAYAATTVGALDLLDAERVLLEVRIATARARADYAIALAQLEGAVGLPVTGSGPEGEPK